ncbi:MAG TPA: tetratricopeptide repeat protein [Blastocatellia bacterium]|nr:tetratricopeptide repeat protein [Blastocatellia bacterium]HMV86533.1 tetratricopeptide repeat protein [Blastocatellia bacterium]HMZ22739.1 tetratricopeptide repeat protein [Blastocatellia bacterium]HNG31397.1 tetratricopeptide repeat protein [Blastocatellia bacterium]
MKRWTTILLTLMALTAAMLMVARWVLPLMGIGGVGGELLSPLARLTPIAATVCVCSIVTLVITLRRQPKPAYPQARRLVEEAETWSDDFIIGEELEIAAAFDEQPLAEEPEVEWSFSRPQLTPAIAPIAGNAKIPAPRTHARLGQDLALREHQNESNGISADQAVNLDFVEIFSDMNGLPITTDTFIQQLPPTLPEFAGRAFELAELLAARTNPENKILSVQGLGGVGKTTLALKLAHQLAPQYPNAQIFVDLKGASSQPLSVAEAQAHVIRAYLPAARLPENEAELGKLYNSVLNGKRALLLFDNAANAGQVAPLLPPDGNLVIVTSRQHLSTGALPGMFASRLDSLPAAEAEELLRRLLPQIGDDATRIAELCGHLPLALRLAASALTQNPNLSVDDYARRLSGDQSPDGAKRHVDAVLRASYEMLVPGLRKLWRTLAVFPDTFEVNAAAAVWKIHPARAANALDRLMAYSLIERNRASGRFRLHDLMMLFAESCLTEKERAIARHHHAAHYQSVLHEADALYEQGGQFLKQGLDLVDMEWHNIQAGQVWAATHLETNRLACELCNSFPDAGRYVLDLRQHPRERIRWSEAALAASHKMQRRKAEGKHLITLGDSYADLSEVHHAINCYEQALEIAQETGHVRGEADALIGLGTAYYLGGGLARAKEFHESALKIARELEDQRIEANAIGSLGLTLYALGDPRAAIECLEAQLHLARNLGDRRNESNALGGLGLAHYALGDVRQAVELLNAQLNITREIGDRRGEANALENLGHACSNLGDHARAIKYHELSLSIARETGDRRSEANALGGLGVTHYLSGEVTKSIELLERQRMLAGEIGDRRGEASALTNLGEAYTTTGEAQRAVELLRQAYSINNQMGDVAGQATALFNLGLALEKLGDHNQAVLQAKIALELFELAEHPSVETVRKQLAEWES